MWTRPVPLSVVTKSPGRNGRGLAKEPAEVVHRVAGDGSGEVGAFVYAMAERQLNRAQFLIDQIFSSRRSQASIRQTQQQSDSKLQTERCRGAIQWRAQRGHFNAKGLGYRHAIT
jgi:hypothetical protein